MKTALVVTDSDKLYNEIQSGLQKGLVQLHRKTSKDFKSKNFEYPESTFLIFIDGEIMASSSLEAKLHEFSFTQTPVILVLSDLDVGDEVYDLLSMHLIQDVLLTPIRPIEVYSKVKHVLEINHALDVFSANQDLRLILDKMEEDLRLARSIQKNLIPQKFRKVHGFKVQHKYLSGLKSGGDYLDFFEFDDGTHIGVIMSDSSSYGLSSSFLSVMMKIGIKLSQNEIKSPAKTIEKLFGELKITMKPKDELSVFYGIFNRKTLEFRYTATGSLSAFVVTDKIEALEFSDKGIKKDGGFDLKDHDLIFQPNHKLILLSDGFSERYDEKNSLKQLIEQSEKEDSLFFMNEIQYKIKKDLKDGDIPAQDCSVMMIEIEKRAMRLAIGG